MISPILSATFFMLYFTAILPAYSRLARLRSRRTRSSALLSFSSLHAIWSNGSSVLSISVSLRDSSSLPSADDREDRLSSRRACRIDRRR